MTRHGATIRHEQKKIVFPKRKKGREKFTTNAKNDKNEIKTQVIYLYHTRYMAIRLLVAHKNKTLEVSQI